jgi:hypothetical protein
MSVVGTLRNWRHWKNRLRSGDSRHGQTCRRLEPVAFDPERTFVPSSAAERNSIEISVSLYYGKG